METFDNCKPSINRGAKGVFLISVFSFLQAGMPKCWPIGRRTYTIFLITFELCIIGLGWMDGMIYGKIKNSIWCWCCCSVGYGPIYMEKRGKKSKKKEKEIQIDSETNEVVDTGVWDLLAGFSVVFGRVWLFGCFGCCGCHKTSQSPLDFSIGTLSSFFGARSWPFNWKLGRILWAVERACIMEILFHFMCKKKYNLFYAWIFGQRVRINNK